MRRRGLIIAIDGPSGAGKGTLARTIARRLGYRHVDTGAMYRAVAWKARQEGLALTDAAAVASLAARASFAIDDRVVIDGHDVTREIRTAAMDAAAAVVAQFPEVRAVLVARQREYGATGALVMEGRDIGSVVFPGADVKVYLDASPDERARRRSRDRAHAASRDHDVHGVAEALEDRDRRDRSRAISPLTVAADAVLIDTTTLPIETVVDQVMALVHAKLPAASSPAT